MSPRKRVKKGLEPNLYETNGYYRYKHPVTKVWRGMGKNKKLANAAARQMNSENMPGQTLIQKFYVDRASGSLEFNMEYLVDRYTLEFLPTKELKPDSLKGENGRLNRIKKDIGSTLLSDVTVKVCADYLDKNFTKSPYVKYRGTLVELFNFAKRKGDFSKDNPAVSTEKKIKQANKKTRQRMSIEQYKELNEIAPEWMKNAMDFAMITLQGRNEVVSAKFEHIDKERNTIKIIRKKTDKHEWAFLELDISPELGAIIKRCRNSGIVSPYIIHHKPVRRNPDNTKEHWSQILPGYLSSELQKVRDKIDLFTCLEKPERPTFHEIRSLGSHLYKKAGYSDEEYVQPLMAHADIAMTKKYQSGHEIEWTRVRADLKLGAVLGN